MSERRYFGTDGIRGRVGKSPMSPDFVLKLGWAAGRVLARDGRRLVLIGKDTRISGYMFESVLESGLSAAGVNTRLIGPLPTPGVAYLTRTFRADAGIVISASHNPYYDNGIKFFSSKGSKLDDALERMIEDELDKDLKVVDSAELGKVTRLADAVGRYIEFCKSTVPAGTELKGLKLIVDCANGAAYQAAPAVFAELGAQVITIGDQPDGLNINAGCGSTNPKRLIDTVLSEQADVGVAVDGDGDRVVMVDADGEFLDGDDLLYIMARSRLRQGILQGGVVGTLMTNLGLEMTLEQLGIPFLRASVGDRFVMELLREKGWQLGGESSGHLIALDKHTTGDGIIAALEILAEMVRSGLTLRELRADFKKFPQVLVNVPMREGFNMAGSEAISRAVETAKTEIAPYGRIVLRTSGTEPLLRIMVEGKDARLVNSLANRLAGIVQDTQS